MLNNRDARIERPHESAAAVDSHLRNIGKVEKPAEVHAHNFSDERITPAASLLQTLPLTVLHTTSLQAVTVQSEN